MLLGLRWAKAVSLTHVVHIISIFSYRIWFWFYIYAFKPNRSFNIIYVTFLSFLLYIQQHHLNLTFSH